MPSTSSPSKEDITHICHMLDYAYDDEDDRFDMTTLVHTVRFHIEVDPVDLESEEIRKEYLELLNAVRGKPENDTQSSRKRKRGDSTSSSAKDSGYEGSSPPSPSKRSSASNCTTSGVTLAEDDREHPNAPIRHLQNWVVGFFGDVFASKAPASEEKKPKTVADWFHGAVHFYFVHSDSKSNVVPKLRPSVEPELRDRIASLTPSLRLAQYITRYSIPIFPSSDLHIEATASTPSPLHPALVRSSRSNESFFLKLVDPAQPGPVKRELRLLKELESKLPSFRAPRLLGVVVDDGHRKKQKKKMPEHTSRDTSTDILGFLLTGINDARPLTEMLEPDAPCTEAERHRWAEEVDSIVEQLHEVGIIWGDAKADNFVVDAGRDLWIIDFGGSYTEGWVDPEKAETKEGDKEGTGKIVDALRDPEGGTFDPEEEGKEEGRETKVRKMQHGEE